MRSHALAARIIGIASCAFLLMTLAACGGRSSSVVAGLRDAGPDVVYADDASGSDVTDMDANASICLSPQACPAQQPSGPCPVCLMSGCNYGCTSCSCVPGTVWNCTLPSCPAVCIGVGPASEGEPCGGGGGGCCGGVGVGSTCPFSCENGGSPGKLACERSQDAAAATWQVTSPCPGPGASGNSDAGDAMVSVPDASDSDVADMDASGAMCSTPNDCPPHGGNQLYCCVNHVCSMDEPDACADGGEQPILALNYDQSCTTDTDCVPISEGNACTIVGPCPSAVISKGAYAKYQSDIANTPCYGLAGCPTYGDPCCRHGVCQMGSACSSPADTLPACADAGGACSPFVTDCASQWPAHPNTGPTDSCAYPDETCCF
jgi:hypothetical protein